MVCDCTNVCMCVCLFEFHTRMNYDFRTFYVLVPINRRQLDIDLIYLVWFLAVCAHTHKDGSNCLLHVIVIVKLLVNTMSITRVKYMRWNLFSFFFFLFFAFSNGAKVFDFSLFLNCKYTLLSNTRTDIHQIQRWIMAYSIIINMAFMWDLGGKKIVAF